MVAVVGCVLDLRIAGDLVEVMGVDSDPMLPVARTTDAGRLLTSRPEQYAAPLWRIPAEAVQVSVD
ncbi:hypothetical protein ABZ478_35405 [Streptomyces sp. NPDC005706]|uniref:hypothetical protein n=1 Tax=Streptomyces sp. NPDC005706 TaxID=3157169 RepID=UPI0033F3A022